MLKILNVFLKSYSGFDIFLVVMVHKGDHTADTLLMLTMHQALTLHITHTN